ncbi:MAG: hypothetical protein ACNA7J_03230 [Wenzhouxiangella sp.]
MRFSSFLSFTMLLVLSMSLTARPPAQHEHDHHDLHGHAVEPLVLDDGQRWSTDLALRSGMEGIRDIFDRYHGAFHDGNMSAADFQVVAAGVNERVSFIFSQCALPPDADAELHKLLASALMAASALEGAGPDDGMRQLHAVLLSYGEFFDHPDWD